MREHAVGAAGERERGRQGSGDLDGAPRRLRLQRRQLAVAVELLDERERRRGDVDAAAGDAEDLAEPRKRRP